MNIFILFTSLLTSIKTLTFSEVPEVKNSQTVIKQVSAFEELKKPLYFEPETLIINFSNGEKKRLQVEEIGLDSSHQLETPKNWQSVGW